MDKKIISKTYQNLQESICNQLEKLDGKATFREDLWNRKDGGGGRSRVIEKGSLIEKGGVNYSGVYGPTPVKILEALKLPESEFYATGVSIVLHPRNPRVPIIHMNVRYFEMSTGEYWFGGGIDLTPHYVDQESGRHIHRSLKNICDQFDSSFYPKFKSWADDYFFLKHRNETRGVGGIFFDRLNDKTTDLSKEQLWHFSQAIGNSFVDIYRFYADLYRHEPFGELEQQWRNLRRGRYVEFNLVWDKGTKFGLDTNGRTESILMSMPPDASWEYDHTPESGSQEAETLKWLKKGIDWIHD